MKNTEKNLDDIIFEKRNKAYGAYMLRKAYSKNLIRAMLISFTLFLMGVSIPLIASYMSEVKYVNEKKEVEIEIGKAKTKVDIKLPEPPKPIEKKVQPYSPPVVTSNPDEVTGDLSDMMDKSNNNFVDTTSRVVDITDDNEKNKVIDDEGELTKFTYVEEMPQFPGGEEARIKFLRENVDYPQLAKEIGTQGMVYLNFTVEKDGSVTEIRILRGIGSGCDEEAERVIALMPNWSPGRQNGKAVRVELNMPISFVLK